MTAMRIITTAALLADCPLLTLLMYSLALINEVYKFIGLLDDCKLKNKNFVFCENLYNK